MRFVQYYLDCLSQASYLIGDETTGTAVVVDPRRDVYEYIADAGRYGLTIIGVINTHFPSDFVAATSNSPTPPEPGSATGAAPRPTTRSAISPTAIASSSAT